MPSNPAPAEIDFSKKTQIPPDVMMQEIDGEAIILNLKSEMYFGLDDIGTHMWNELSNSNSIQAACDSLAAQYAVEKETLKKDLQELLHKLLEQGLLVQTDGNAV